MSLHFWWAIVECAKCHSLSSSRCRQISTQMGVCACAKRLPRPETPLLGGSKIHAFPVKAPKMQQGQQGYGEGRHLILEVLHHPLWFLTGIPCRLIPNTLGYSLLSTSKYIRKITTKDCLAGNHQLDGFIWGRSNSHSLAIEPAQKNGPVEEKKSIFVGGFPGSPQAHGTFPSIPAGSGPSPRRPKARRFKKNKQNKNKKLVFIFAPRRTMVLRSATCPSVDRRIHVTLGCHVSDVSDGGGEVSRLPPPRCWTPKKTRPINIPSPRKVHRNLEYPLQLRFLTPARCCQGTSLPSRRAPSRRRRRRSRATRCPRRTIATQTSHKAPSQGLGESWRMVSAF